MSNLVKVKYHDIIIKKEKATLFLFEEKEIWLPNKLFKFVDGKNIYLPNFLAIEKKLNAKQIADNIHQPKELKPVYNQEPINELIYEKIS